MARLSTSVRRYDCGIVSAPIFGKRQSHALTVQMMRYVTAIDYIVTETEIEALILENNLIKAHQPRYNVKLKDDKRYPYLRVTVNEPFPPNSHYAQRGKRWYTLLRSLRSGSLNTADLETAHQIVSYPDLQPTA